jgi:hypothetical protein
MKKMLAGFGLLAAFALPVGAVAKPDESDKRAAIAECKAERGKTSDTRAAFKLKYGSMSRCFKKTAAEEEAEEETALKNAAKECKAERSDPDFAGEHGGKTFEQHYGTNANGKNAFGKCVSSKAREIEAELDAEDAEEAKKLRNAAKECAAERAKPGNAFGKCVSERTRGDTASD